MATTTTTKQKLKPKRGSEKHNGASRCPLAAWTDGTDETERTYDPTLTPLQTAPLAPLPLSPPSSCLLLHTPTFIWALHARPCM